MVDADLDIDATSGVRAPGPAQAGAPSGWAARWLDRALRIVDAGPRPFYRAAVVSLGVTSVLAVTVAAVTKTSG